MWVSSRCPGVAPVDEWNCTITFMKKHVFSKCFGRLWVESDEWLTPNSPHVKRYLTWYHYELLKCCVYSAYQYQGKLISAIILAFPDGMPRHWFVILGKVTWGRHSPSVQDLRLTRSVLLYNLMFLVRTSLQFARCTEFFVSACFDPDK